jgi:hypothetical protein
MKMKVLFTLITLWLCLGGVKVYAQDVVITDLQGLKNFRDEVNGYNGKTANTFDKRTIYLKADIDLSEETVAWTPIGTADHPFKGHFEGWGHKITNLTVNTGTGDYAGLFGHINGGSVRDLGVEGTTISGGNYVGGICGKFTAGEINSCYSSIAVSGTQYVGGLCGLSGGKLENCWHEGDVTASKTTDVYAGGLVGESTHILQRCYVINTKVKVDNIVISALNSGDPVNAFFGFLVGHWGGSDMGNCVYETTSVYVSDLAGGNFAYGSDLAVGSSYGAASPASGFKGCEEKDMKKTATWDGVLNTDYDGVLDKNNNQIANNNVIWYLKKDPKDSSALLDYPQPYSFEKNLPITFNFTTEKWWLTIVPNGNYAVPNGVTAYKVISATAPTDKDAGVATLVKVTTLNEGCGALLYSEVGEAIPANERPTGELDDYTDNLLKGSPTYPETIGGTAWGESTDYILQDGAFVKANLGTIARGKAYLHAPFSAGSKLRFVFADESMTSVDAVQESLESDAVWYAMDGRKLEGEPTEKGVYIVNGKKVMIQ